MTSQRVTARLAREHERTLRRQVIARRRIVAVGLFALVAAAAALTVALASGQRAHTGAALIAHGEAANQSSRAGQPSSFEVGLRVLRLVDTTRAVQLPGGQSEPRTLVTYVRYPALGAPARTDVPDAAAAHADGPFPLVIFGHGFGVTPELYARLLQAWARAGYVVAAPVFPLENENAPGGPDESDLPNQPADMRFVISRLLQASDAGRGPLAGLIDPRRIAVTGQSDGGDTALAVAYDSHFHDPRISAVIILSGAEMPGLSGLDFPRGSPPLLAAQGTADTVNPPSFTNGFFGVAQRPKYLLSLIGAEHLPPYSTQEPQLAIVERVSTAFLHAYLERRPGAIRQLQALGNVAGIATMLAEP